MFIWSKDSRKSFRNRKWNYFTHFYFEDQNFFRNRIFIWSKDSITSFKNEIEFSKQEMELFHPFLLSGSKNFFWNMIFIWSKDSKTSFEKRKWNFLNRKWNFLNRKWNNFTHFHSSDQNIYFGRWYLFDPMILKYVLRMEWNFHDRKWN